MTRSLRTRLALTALALFASSACADDTGGNDGTGGSGAAAGMGGSGGSGGGSNNCDGRGIPYVSGVEAKSDDGTLVIAIMDAVPAPPAVLVDNVWEIVVHDGSENPIEGATVVVRPFMVDHGHGSPKTVVVTDMGEGRYHLEPLHFQMSGYWETKIEVTHDGATQSAMYPFCI